MSSLKIVNVRYQVDTSDLQNARAAILENARAAGLSEDAARKIADAYQDQVKGIEQVRKELKKEKTAIDQVDSSAKRLNKDLDFDEIAREAKEATKQTKKLGLEVDKTAKAGKKSKSSLNFSNILNLGSSIALAGGLAGAVSAAGDALLSFGKKALGGAADLEQTRVAFTTFLGSAEQAEQVIGELNEFSTITPFEPEQVREAGQALLAFGVESENLIDRLARIGDISAGTGKDFNELAVIFGKARVSGTLFAEDINQLTEAGIPVIDEFAKILGVSNDQVKKLASEGKISFDVLEKAFSNLTSEGGKFAGLTAAQSQTLAGRFSTLVGQVNALVVQFGEKLAPAAKVVVSFLSALTQRAGEIFSAFDPFINSVKNLREQFIQLLEGLGIAVPQFDAVDFVVKGLQLGFRQLTLGVTALIQGITNLVSGFNFLVDVGKAVGATFSEISSIITEVFDNFLSFDFSSIGSRITGAFSSSLSDAQAAREANRIARTLEKAVEETEPVEARPPLDIEIDPVTPVDKNAQKIKREAEKAAKEAEKLEAATAKLRFEIQVESAGGENTVAGLALLMDQAIKELEASEEFQNLRLQDEQLANQRILQIRQDFQSKINDLIKKGATDQVAEIGQGFDERIAAISQGLQQQLAAQDQLLTEIVTSETATADERIQAEKRLTLAKIQLQVDYAEKAIQEAQRVATENQNFIAGIQAQLDSGLLTESEQVDLQAQLQERLAIQQQLENSLLESQATFNEARLALVDEAASQEEEREAEKAEKLKGIAKGIATFGAATFNVLGDVFEAVTNRQLAAAEGNEEKQKEIQLKQFRRQKALQIGQTLINGAAAIVAQLAQTPLPAGLPFVIAIGLQTIASIAKIASQQPPAFAKGVIDLQGPGTKTSDSIPSLLSRGESVMTADQTRENYDMLRKIHSGKKLHEFRTPDGAIAYSFDPGINTMFSSFNPQVRTGIEILQLERIAAGMGAGMDYESFGRAVANAMTSGEYNPEGLRYRTFQMMYYSFGEILKRMEKK